MTATVTYSDGVTPLAPYAHPMHGNDRANLGHDGQLWERLAEAKPNVLSDAYSLRLMDATLNAYMRAGERAQRCLCPDDCNCRRPWRSNYCGCHRH